MTYSCTDFVDSILDALDIVVPDDAHDDPSAQADLALEAIRALKSEATFIFGPTNKPLGPIVVAMEGGLFSSVVTKDARLYGIEVHTIDYDTEGVDEDEIRRVVQHDGSSAEAVIGQCSIHEATINLEYLLAWRVEDYEKIARANGWECGPDGRWFFVEDAPLEGMTFATAQEVCKYEELI